jgi:hypothetical protein
MPHKELPGCLASFVELKSTLHLGRGLKKINYSIHKKILWSLTEDEKSGQKRAANGQYAKQDSQRNMHYQLINL